MGSGFEQAVAFFPQPFGQVPWRPITIHHRYGQRLLGAVPPEAVARKPFAIGGGVAAIQGEDLSGPRSRPAGL